MDNAQLMTQVFEASSDAKLLVRSNGKVYLANLAARRLLTTDSEILTGKPVKSLFVGKSIKKIKDLLLAPKSSGVSRSELELNIKGENKILDIITNPDIAPGLHLIIIRDITEKTLDQEARVQFMAIAGHELKTPIAVISAYTDLLKRRFADDSTVLSYLGKITEKTELLTNYINGILDEIRIGTGKFFMNDTEIDFDELVNSVVGDINKTFPSASITISGKSGEKILADKERIAQVIRNIIMNAIKYTPRTKVIEVKLEGAGGRACFSVKDKGPGVSLKEQSLIFKAFYRSVRTAKNHKGGMGLGLYIAKQVIRKYGGKISVNSRRGKGSEFVVELPSIRA